MKNIKFFVGTGNVGSYYSQIIPFEDEATNEEIEAAFKEWREEQLDYGWDILSHDT